MGVDSGVSDLSSRHSLTHTAMSDEEYAEEESMSNTSRKGDGTFMKARGEAKKGELDEQLKETINEWRKQRAKEEEELKKAKEAQEKRKRLEEAEKKRQAMVTAQKEKQEARGMVVEHKMPPVNTGGHKEVTKTKAQLEEEKKVCLSLRIKPIDLEGLETEQLKSKANELWETVIRLETEKYDLEERGKRQGHDLKVLNERQIQRLRLKAVRMGLHAEALTGKYPPKIKTASKFERSTDYKSYEDKQRLFDGGWEVIAQEYLEKEWNDKMGDLNKHPKSKLPKWY